MGEINMKIPKEMRSLLVGILIALIAIIFASLKSCENRKLQEENNLLEGLQDTIRTMRNKDGTQTTIISMLQATSTKAFLDIKTKDETILWLQREVEKEKKKIKGGGGIVVIGGSTTFTGTSTNTIVAFNPVINGDTVYQYPTYKTINDGKDTLWVKYTIVASKDKTTLDLKVINKYKVVIGTERVSLFKRKSIVEVTNLNPYTSTETLRAFEVKDNRKTRISLGVQGGYGFTLKGLSPYVGLGVNYRLL